MRKLLFFIFTLLTYSVIAQSDKEFDPKDYLKNGDYLYNNTTSHKHEVLEILVNQKNKIFVNGSYFQTVKDIRPTILDFIKERKSYSRIIITIKSKSTDSNIDNDIINSLGSYLIKQGITPKQGMVFLNPKDLVIPKEEVKPPPPPPEIPEKIDELDNKKIARKDISLAKCTKHDKVNVQELEDNDTTTEKYEQKYEDIQRAFMKLGSCPKCIKKKEELNKLKEELNELYKMLEK